MKTIRDYIESLFLRVPKNEETDKIKEDLLANAEDRYDDLKQQGVSENEAIGKVIAEFGNIDELIQEMNLGDVEETVFEDEINAIKMEEMLGFMSVRRKASFQIGLGVLSILLGIGLMFVFLAFFGNQWNDALGSLFILAGVAVSIPFFIIGGMAISANNRELDDRLITEEIKQETLQMKEAFRNTFTFCMVLGVVSCIIAIGIVILSFTFSTPVNEDALSFVNSMGLAFFFFSVGIGVFLFIFGGVNYGSFQKFTETKYFISDEDHLGPRAKEERRNNLPPILRVVESFYWPVVVVYYLFYSFNTNNWATSWVVFVVAGIIYGILESLFATRKY